MNLPNFLTILRILLVPVIGLLLLRGAYGTSMWLFLAAGITDGLDGYIARRFDQMTYLGSLLDPLADKLLVLLTTVILAGQGRLPWWLAAGFVLRDLVITGGALAWYLRTRHLEMAPSLASKLNTFIQVGLLYLLLAQGAGWIGAGGWLPVLFALALLSTVISGGHYVLVWGRKARHLEGACL